MRALRLAACVQATCAPRAAQTAFASIAAVRVGAVPPMLTALLSPQGATIEDVAAAVSSFVFGPGMLGAGQ